MSDRKPAYEATEMISFEDRQGKSVSADNQGYLHLDDTYDLVHIGFNEPDDMIVFAAGMKELARQWQKSLIEEEDSNEMS